MSISSLITLLSIFFAPAGLNIFKPLWIDDYQAFPNTCLQPLRLSTVLDLKSSANNTKEFTIYKFRDDEILQLKKRIEGLESGHNIEMQRLNEKMALVTDEKDRQLKVSCKLTQYRVVKAINHQII